MKRRGQSLIEYAVFIFCLVAALIAMQIYIKRGIQGRLRQSTDDIGEQFDAKDTAMNITDTSSGKTVTDVRITQDSDGDGHPDDNNNDGKIDDKDYITITESKMGYDQGNPDVVGTPEVTTHSGTEDVGPFGGLYDQ